MKADITKREELNRYLDHLTENAEAKWGLMKPQHMIEHLTKTVQYTNGKKQAALRTTEKEAGMAREGFIYTDVEMSRGLKSPLAGDTPDPFEFSGLDEAKNNLNTQLDDFEAYFASHPSATFIHPRLGSLTCKEWIVFHNKHFTHHFKQFGLL